MKMTVNASIRQKVEVDPTDVLEKLIEQEIGYRCWVFEEEGKYYKGFERSAGCHSQDDQEEITKETYDYVQSIKLTINYINNKNIIKK